MWMDRLPYDDVDGISVRMNPDADTDARAALVIESGMKIIYIAAGAPHLMSGHFDSKNPGWIPDLQVKLTKRDSYVVTVLLVGGAYVIQVDGEEKMQIRTDATRFTTLSLQTTVASTSFDRIQLRRRRK
jgi:hypothetical protein